MNDVFMTTEKMTEEKKEKDVYKGRPDYYPFNQEWMDDYFERWSSSSLNS